MGAPGLLSRLHLVSGLARFHEWHPHVQIELRVIDHLTLNDMQTRGIDVLVSLGWPGDIPLVQHRLAPSRLVVCASPAYWERHGMPVRPLDLAAHECLLVRSPEGTVLDLWRHERAGQAEQVAVRGWLISESRDDVLQAVLARQATRPGFQLILSFGHGRGQLHSELVQTPPEIPMDLFIPLLLIALAAFAFNSRDQKRRIALLGSHLQQHQIEKLMEGLTQGYLRALGESDPERRAQIWSLLNTAEMTLCEQFDRFVADWSKVGEAEARMSRFAFAIPQATRLFPGHSFDSRQALAIHAQGIANMARNTLRLSARDKAFTLCAELFLMQHTCHWYCRSRTVASARLLARHQTSHAQVLASVSPDTRAAYLALIRG